MLSRIDETDLVVPLHEGVQESPPWRTFLSRLCRRARADGAALIVRANGRTIVDPLTFAFARSEPLTWPDSTALHSLRPGRVYDGEELGERATALRVIRISEAQGGASAAWMMIQRHRDDFAAMDSALLSGLAPHAAVALRTWVTLRRVDGRAAASQAALDRIGTGWLALGPDGRIVDIDPLAAKVLRTTIGLTEGVGERLPLGTTASQALAAALTAFAGDPEQQPRIIRLSDLPPLHLLAVGAPRGIDATLLGFVREPRTSDARAPVFAALTGLPPSEARLAIAMSQTPTLSDAAATLGLSIETARNYSKRIYAHTGTRGQPDLVRLVLDGLTALS